VNETHPGQLGPLTAFFRDRNKEHIWRADSSNEGLKWSKRVPTMLPNANKAVQALTLEATTSNTVVVFNNNRCDYSNKRR
jgi:predicted neuraminidase